MSDTLDREVVDLLDVVIAGAPRCRWSRRYIDGTIASLPCDEPATVYAYDVANAQHMLACVACAATQRPAEEWDPEVYKRHPTIRLPHADALERTIAKRDRLKGAT